MVAGKKCNAVILTTKCQWTRAEEKKNNKKNRLFFSFYPYTLHTPQINREGDNHRKLVTRHGSSKP